MGDEAGAQARHLLVEQNVCKVLGNSVNAGAHVTASPKPAV
jgi:hypothetical protein